MLIRVQPHQQALACGPAIPFGVLALFLDLAHEERESLLREDTKLEKNFLAFVAMRQVRLQFNQLQRRKAAGSRQRAQFLELLVIIALDL